jgi:hypothetical protein
LGFYTKMKLNKKYEFKADFSEYEEESELNLMQSNPDEKKSKINIYKSKWSPHTDTLVMLNDIRMEMKRLGVIVGADSKKIQDLKNYLATMQQIFMMVKGLLGEIKITDFKERIRKYRKAIRVMDFRNEVDDKINDNLLTLQEDLEEQLDYLNLNLEKTTMYSNTKKAEDMIRQ